ncbi:Head binding [Klebsiella pneumoniae]|uniref:Head binding n=1 Tax=Klebsiella pneumoniae TaxID=573 RepID=A0A377XP05_KLEPN|nr:Head binding [Klebsiella pneumoniae]
MTDTNYLVSMPSAPFSTPRAFKSVTNGRIYIGQPDTDPTIPENQIPVYVVNEDGSEVQISQPVVINAGGFPVYNGQIMKFVTKQNFSMAVYDAHGVQQFYWPDISQLDPSVAIKEIDELRSNLGSSEGLGLVGQCSSLAELRNVEFLFSGQQIFVAEHTIGMGQGGGIFYCHSLTNDDGLIDDNGFQIINNYGQVIRRKDRSRMSAEMFGAIGGQDVMPVLENIRKASITFNRAVCYFPPPANGINYLHSGGFVVDVTQGYGLCIVCESTDEIDVPFDHTGNNIAFTFKRDNAAASTAFYKQSGITGALIRGRNSDNTAAGNDGFAVRVSDIIKAKVNVFANGYTNTSGAAISLYNDTGYTEKSRIKATIRGCCNGVLIHRNAAEGATSTNSFMGTHLDIEYQAGVPGKANKGISVGNIDGTTTSNTFDVSLYASEISLKYWAEAGAITNGIYVGRKAIVPESTTADLISDGYGFSTSDTDTTTIAATNLIRVENGGISVRNVQTSQCRQA